MDITEKIGKLINEASTLSSLGVTPAQIKAVYRRGGWADYAPDANATWQKVTGKKAVADLMRSTGTYRVAVAGVDRDGNLFLTITYRDGEYRTAKYAPDGEVLASWNEKSPRKAISYYTGVRDYYLANAGTVTKQGTQDLEEKPVHDNTELAYKLAKVISKQAEKLFQEARAKVAKNVSDKMTSGDFAGAFAILKHWVHEGNFSSDLRDNELREMVMNSWSAKSFREWLGEILAGEGGVPSYGYYPYIEGLFKDASDAALRKAGAELLRKIKERLDEHTK